MNSKVTTAVLVIVIFTILGCPTTPVEGAKSDPAKEFPSSDELLQYLKFGLQAIHGYCLKTHVGSATKPLPEHTEESVESCIRPELEKILKNLEDDQNQEEGQLAASALYDLKTGKHLDKNEIDAFRSKLVAPGCRIQNTLIHCFKPYVIQELGECIQPDLVRVQFEYVELLLKAACKNEGKEYVDLLVLLTDKATRCDPTDKVSHCADHNHARERISNPHNATQLCESLEMFHMCLTQSMESCPRKEVPKTWRSILDDVKPWFSDSCKEVTSAGVVAASSGSIFYFATLILVTLLNN